jgi:hypothetical protein
MLTNKTFFFITLLLKLHAKHHSTVIASRLYRITLSKFRRNQPDIQKTHCTLNLFLD